MKAYKRLFLLPCLVMITSTLWSQDAALAWENTIGGDLDEFGKCVISTFDGGYLIGGTTNSPVSGDLTEGSHGDQDYLVIKLDSLGNVQWQQTYGGVGTDMLTCMVEYAGTYYIGGYSNSPSCPDKPENCLGGYDYWVIRITPGGGIMWSNVVGGTGDDYLYSMTKCNSPAGIILGGSSNSNVSPDKMENTRGGLDYWFVRLDPGVGNLMNEKTIGGNNDDRLRTIFFDNTMMSLYAAGYSSSDSSGEKNENSYGNEDYWVMRMGPFFGPIMWQKTYGSTGTDHAQCMLVDGLELLVSGYSNSPIGGNKTDSSVAYDYWTLKLNTFNGDILWQQTYGSSGDDYCFGITKADNGDYLITGDAYSPASYELLQQTAGVDWWLLSLDSANGNIEWQNTLTGSYDEYSGTVKHVNNGYIFIGGSNSNAGYDKSESTIGSPGSYDVWMAKLNEVGCIDPVFTGITISDTLICEGDSLTVQFAGTLNSAFAWSMVQYNCPMTNPSYMEILDTAHQFTFVPSTYTPYYAFVNGTCTPPVICYPVNLVVIPSDLPFSVDEDSLCTTYAPVNINTYPPGGILTGTGISGNMFDPSLAGPGVHILTYSFSLPNCTTSNTDTVTVIGCLGVDENTQEPIHIFPNPAHDQINITSKNGTSITTVEIIDLSGRIVFTANNSFPSVIIDINTLNSGSYLVKTTTSVGISVEKMIKY